MTFICPRCNYENNHKNNMRKHLKKKKPCNIVNRDIELEECLDMLEKGIKTSEEELKKKNKEFEILKELNEKQKNIIKQQKELILSQEKIIKEQKEEIGNLKDCINKEPTNEYNKECIYLILEREFINNTVKVGKLGKSKTFRNRMGDYPKGSKIIHVKRCKNSSKSEEELLVLFGILFKQRTDVGKEYFEGDLDEMSKQIDSYFYNQDKKLVNKDKLVSNANILSNTERNLLKRKL